MSGIRISPETKNNPKTKEASMLHQAIETLNSRVALRPRYDNFIGGKWVAPVDGRYFDNISPITGKMVCQIARSQSADIELALDAAHKAKDAWGKAAPAARAAVLNKIADRMEENLKVLAAVETIDNGKPIRETTFADIPLAIDHFRYFAACVRAQEGSLSELDHDTVAYHYHEPLGVVGQIIPWNFPILMASWKRALEIANDTLYGLGAGVWTRDLNRAYRFGRGIQAGRVWTNCYHLYPAHSAFGGYKKSGFGRENHKMMLDHYQQTKNVLVSYSPKAIGFF
jgi:acyl-CoA reductase-like NAD-dependent aldehyde dehydrogenase